MLLFWFSTLVLMKEMYNLISENLTKIFHSKRIFTENQQPVNKYTPTLAMSYLVINERGVQFLFSQTIHGHFCIFKLQIIVKCTLQVAFVQLYK